jgi:NTP pyrophosphatase (non-canonical NTP hydrolase)
LQKQLPTLFAWYCSIVLKSNPKDLRLSEILWSKYPNCCPYCLSNQCTCPRNKKYLNDNSKILQEKAIKNESHRPHTMSEWQDMFSRLYPRSTGYDQKNNFMYLIEEIGETAEAYRLNYFHPNNLDNELADVLTWIFGIANLLDSKAKEAPSLLVGESEFILEKKLLKNMGMVVLSAINHIVIA